MSALDGLRNVRNEQSETTRFKIEGETLPVARHWIHAEVAGFNMPLCRRFTRVIKHFAGDAGRRALTSPTDPDRGPQADGSQPFEEDAPCQFGLHGISPVAAVS